MESWTSAEYNGLKLLSLNTPNCLSVKAGMGNQGTGWGEWWEYGESRRECGESGWECGESRREWGETGWEWGESAWESSYKSEIDEL